MKAALVPALLATLFACLFPVPCRAEGVVVQWEKIYNVSNIGADGPGNVTVDSAGNVIVTGHSTQNTGSGWGSYIAKYSAANGALLWEKRSLPILNVSKFLGKVAVDGADNVIVLGSIYYENIIITSDMYIVKYAGASGALLWEKIIHPPGSQNNGGTSLALDSGGNIVVTGYTAKVQDLNDYYTAKYAAANGALLWERRYDGGVDRWDLAHDVATDNEGNAIVTGTSTETETGIRGYYTAKYAAADGALLWEQPYSGPVGSSVAHQVALDSQGNAIVTGSSGNSGSVDVYTAKYAAADGVLLWERRLIGPGGGQDFAFLALDDADNVIVAANVRGVTNEAHLAKYAAADGTLLWEKRSSNILYAYRSGVLDDAGNVIVTGEAGRGNNTDIYTAKYAAADGALLWEKRYNGTRNGTDLGIALAMDSAGGIVVVGFTNFIFDTAVLDSYIVKYVPLDLDLDDDGLLDAWEITHFGSTAGQSALDDTDGDGVVELLELAFGSDPRKPDGAAGPAVVVEDGYLTATIVKQPGVTYLVETGAMLNGDFSAASTTVLPSTAETLKVRDNVPIGTEPARFLRVQIIAAP